MMPERQPRCQLRRYTPADAGVWDAFVEASRNGTFLFQRAYMDYHADRFTDHSLLFYNPHGTLIALLPANLAPESDGSLALHSHQGLTYGGFIIGTQATLCDVLDLFQATLNYLLSVGIHAFYYKQMPTCYHLYPSQEDDYALWRMGAEQVACAISTTIALNDYYTIPMQYRRRRGIVRATRQGYSIHSTTDLTRFWDIMEENLRERYHTSPVHSRAEMELLMARFPDNIKCYVSEHEGVAEGGVVVYLCRNVVHAQYIQSSPTGRADGALDLLISTLINTFADAYQYFDLGISTEDGGRYLNENLIAQKEGFGGRGITYKQWRFLI